MSRNDRRHLEEFIKVFERPEETASKYRRFSYLWFTIAFICLVTGSALSALEIVPDVEGALLITAGVLIGLGILYRMGAKQVPILVRYAEFRIEKAKAALRDE
jgi:membrane protein DedA with SNARE-associated domain